MLKEKITKLSCSLCELTDIDLSSYTLLKVLECQHNKLTNLDLSKNTYLAWLFCEGNNLTNLDLSKNTYLTKLCCKYNNIKMLDLRNCKSLTKANIQCDDNVVLIWTDEDYTKYQNELTKSNDFTQSITTQDNNTYSITQKCMLYFYNKGGIENACLEVEVVQNENLTNKIILSKEDTDKVVNLALELSQKYLSK